MVNSACELVNARHDGKARTASSWRRAKEASVSTEWLMVSFLAFFPPPDCLPLFFFVTAPPAHISSSSSTRLEARGKGVIGCVL